MLLLWMGEQITARGIGNGVSLIIFAGIVAELPKAIVPGCSSQARATSVNVVFVIAIAGHGDRSGCDLHGVHGAQSQRRLLDSVSETRNRRQ
jgi:hypothetical protein